MADELEADDGSLVAHDLTYDNDDADAMIDDMENKDKPVSQSDEYRAFNSAMVAANKEGALTDGVYDKYLEARDYYKGVLPDALEKSWTALAIKFPKDYTRLTLTHAKQQNAIRVLDVKHENAIAATNNLTEVQNVLQLAQGLSSQIKSTLLWGQNDKYANERVVDAVTVVAPMDYAISVACKAFNVPRPSDPIANSDLSIVLDPSNLWPQSTKHKVESLKESHWYEALPMSGNGTLRPLLVNAFDGALLQYARNLPNYDKMVKESIESNKDMKKWSNLVFEDFTRNKIMDIKPAFVEDEQAAWEAVHQINTEFRQILCRADELKEITRDPRDDFNMLHHARAIEVSKKVEQMPEESLEERHLKEHKQFAATEALRRTKLAIFQHRESLLA